MQKSCLLRKPLRWHLTCVPGSTRISDYTRRPRLPDHVHHLVELFLGKRLSFEGAKEQRQLARQFMVREDGRT
jgi:hypothetical protein